MPPMPPARMAPSGGLIDFRTGPSAGFTFFPTGAGSGYLTSVSVGFAATTVLAGVPFAAAFAFAELLAAGWHAMLISITKTSMARRSH